jgi:hypothetical protein
MPISKFVIGTLVAGVALSDALILAAAGAQNLDGLLDGVGLLRLACEAAVYLVPLAFVADLAWAISRGRSKPEPKKFAVTTPEDLPK